MNYRHAYHAGNFADVMKHLALVLVIEHLKRKEKPFFLLDTHAGTGRTDLSGEEAQKTGEFRDGISRILGSPDIPANFAPYMDMLAELGCDGADGGPSFYPGSPQIARHLGRAGERFAFCELHPQDAARLRHLFRRDKSVTVFETDGYGVLKSMLPPRERRGMVLIDPPFESRDEFDRVYDSLQDAVKRWPTGTCLVWYPVKNPSVSGAFIERLSVNGPGKTLRAELHIRIADGARLSGCGLVIVNPPWQLDETLRSAFAWLADRLAQGEGAYARVEWLRD